MPANAWASFGALSSWTTASISVYACYLSPPSRRQAPFFWETNLAFARLTFSSVCCFETSRKTEIFTCIISWSRCTIAEGARTYFCLTYTFTWVSFVSHVGLQLQVCRSHVFHSPSVLLFPRFVILHSFNTFGHFSTNNQFTFVLFPSFPRIYIRNFLFSNFMLTNVSFIK